MATSFADHPRKKNVRENWDTPILKRLRECWHVDYLYFGLPGPEAADVWLWREMIRRVIAFELEADGVPDARRDIVALNKQLALMSVKYSVYCGPMEEVVLKGSDYDGRALVIDEFVTLYNLDFCNAITGRVTTRHGRKCLRFEALRALVTRQREIYRATGSRRFVILLTVREEFHVSSMRQFAASEDLPQATKNEVLAAGGVGSLPKTTMGRNARLLRAFVFTHLREYLRGHNVASAFLPPVKYAGLTGTPMIHFVVVCSMSEPESAAPRDPQAARQFLSLPIITVSEVPCSSDHGVPPLEPLKYLKWFTD